MTKLTKDQLDVISEGERLMFNSPQTTNSKKAKRKSEKNFDHVTNFKNVTVRNLENLAERYFNIMRGGNGGVYSGSDKAQIIKSYEMMFNKFSFDYVSCNAKSSQNILEMLNKGKITSTEAMKLMQMVNAGGAGDTAQQSATAPVFNIDLGNGE